MEKFQILDIVENNKFLKMIYPNGIFNYFIGQVSLELSSSIHLVLHIRDTPSIEIPKWGKWGTSYNIVTIELSTNLVHHVEIKNWENNDYSNCNNEITKQIIENKEIYNIRFFKKDWSIDLMTNLGLLYQRSTVYILD